MADLQLHTVFGEGPDGPLDSARAILSFMSAAWFAEGEALDKATSDTRATEFACLAPRIHGDCLDAVINLVELSMRMLPQRQQQQP